MKNVMENLIGFFKGLFTFSLWVILLMILYLECCFYATGAMLLWMARRYPHYQVQETGLAWNVILPCLILSLGTVTYWMQEMPTRRNNGKPS